MGSRLVEIKNRIQASQWETASTGSKTTTRSGTGGSRVRGIKRKMVADVDGEYVQSFLNDSRDYITNTQREYEGLTWQNARSEEINVSRANASATMNERSRKVRTYLDAYKEDIPEEQYTVLKNYLDDFSTFQDQVAAGFRSTRTEFSQFDTEDDNHAYLTTQKQLAEDPDRLNREIAVLENMYTIYEDLTTREISEAEEAKLARLRQQYPFLGDLKAAIKEKKKYFKTVTQLQDQAKQADERVVWEAEYSDKSYAELQKILGRLDAGAEKTWLSDYADTKKTKDDWEKELTDAQADLAYYEKLRSERDRLMQFQAMSPDTPGYVQLKKQWEAYHNQFDGLDERIDALEKKIWEQERIVRYYDLSQNEDYAEKSQYYGGGDALQEMVNNPEMTGFLDNAATVGKLINPGVGAASLLYEVLPYDNLQHMTNNERADYNYIYATEGKEAAKDYLEWLQYTLDERSMNNAMTIVSDATQSIPVLSQVTASLLSTPVALMGGTGLLDAAGQKLVNKITGENKPINYNRDAMFFTKASGTARGTVAQNIADATGVIDFDEEKHPVLSRILNGKSLADVYQLGMSMQDSAAIAGLAAINPVLGKVGTVLLATSSGTDAMLNAVSKGASDEQALTMGILTAGFEMIFEKYELESLLGQGKNFWQAFCKQGLSEAVGEGATEVANILADVAVMAEKSDWRQNINRYLAENPGWDYSKAEKQAFIDALLQVGEASFGGWISGSTMGGGYSVIQNIADNVQKNQQAYNLYGQVQQELVTEALELNPNNAYAQKLQGKLDSDKQLSGAQLRKLVAQNEAVIQKQDTQNATTSQSDKVNQNPTARNVGQLNATVQAANTQVNAAITPEDVTNMLKSKRVDTKTATGITDAIVASLNGRELTKTQSERLSSALDSPTVRSVVSELMKKKADGIDSTLKNAYDEINTIGGNENGRETALWNLQNQRADGSLLSSQTQTRAEDENGSGVPGTLREDGSSPDETLSAARRGLISDLEEFSADDYATVTEGSALHQVQNAFSEEYGIECHIIKDSSWMRSSPAYSRNGVVYIREGIDLGTLSTAVPHEATHVMKQQSFQPYIDFLSQTPDALNFQSATIWRLLGVVSKHKNIDPFDATSQQLLSFYDELNSTVYGLYKSGILNSNKFEYREYIPGVFYDFTSYIQAMDRLHEEFRNQRNASGQTKAADRGVDALMNLANKNDLIQKKSHGVDSAQKRVYDDSNIRDGIPNEESTELQNLSDQGIDAFSNHDNGTVIDGAALQQFQNAFLEEIHEGGASVPRPTWRQSELDAVADFPEYKAQKSFMNGKEVPYGTKGSVRPDYYKSGFSVDIKNYNVESTNSRSSLARNIETQYSQRIENLPDGTKQAVLIDVRGQNVSISVLLVLYNDIIQRTNNGVEVLFKMN